MKLDSEVFRECAMDIVHGKRNYCCTALKYIGPNELRDGHTHYVKLLSDIFNDEELTSVGMWWGDFMIIDERHARVNALLLCAEIVEDMH